MSHDSQDEVEEGPELERLRTAIRQIYAYLSAKDLLRLAERYAKRQGTRDVFSDRSLRNFLDPRTSQQSRSISKASHDALAALAYASPVGRALRNLASNRTTPLDDLVFALGRGVATVPRGLRVEGAFHLYHGSYLFAAHYVVRHLTIRPEPDGVVAVTDLVRDHKTAAKGERRAEGVMVFEDGRAQILLRAHENKQGLSLIIFNDEGTGFDRCYGAMMVMNARREVAFRPCLLIRGRAGEASETMVRETGIFRAEDLRDPSRARHLHAFQDLREYMTAHRCPDPMLDWPSPDLRG